jgi:hypothetical protein
MNRDGMSRDYMHYIKTNYTSYAECCFAQGQDSLYTEQDSDASMQSDSGSQISLATPISMWPKPQAAMSKIAVYWMSAQ